MAAIEALRPHLCPICYRNVSIRTRLIFILEVLSYLVFLFLLYPIIRILLIPIHVYQFFVWIFSKCSKEEGDGDEEDDEISKVADEPPKQVQKVMPTGDYHQTLLQRRHPVWSALSKYQRKQKIVTNNTLLRDAYHDSLATKEKLKLEDAEEAKTLNAIQHDMNGIMDKFLSEKMDRAQTEREDILPED